MQTWKWLYSPEAPFNWRFIRNVVIKTALLFVALNVVFALTLPLPKLGKLSIYNVFVPGRERLPYSDNPAAAYSLSVDQLDALFASHEIAGDGHPNDYRVILIGDSSVWGFLLENDDTLAANLNRGAYQTDQGQRVRVYNLGYPTMSLTKDLMLLDYAMRYEPDLIVWSFTLRSFGQEAQLDTALVQHNPDRVRDLIVDYGLRQDVDDARFVEPDSVWEKTIIKQRRTLADILRLQLYAIPWAVTGIDQEIRTDYTPRSVDLDADESWNDYLPDTFTPDALAFDVLHAGLAVAGDTPVLFINEPMYISDGENSDLRYNAFFPIWAYDEYRALLAEQAETGNWQLLDLWDSLPEVACYTDSPVHLTPTCSAQLSEWVGTAILDMTNTGTIANSDNTP